MLTSAIRHRRAKTLRTYAGDTSLPGGKAEERDRSIEDTAVMSLRRVKFTVVEAYA